LIQIKSPLLGFELSNNEFIPTIVPSLVWKNSTRTWTKNDTILVVTANRLFSICKKVRAGSSLPTAYGGFDDDKIA
jgi:hypothetical protein